jgi:hypothetical protein
MFAYADVEDVGNIDVTAAQNVVQMFFFCQTLA